MNLIEECVKIFYTNHRTSDRHGLVFRAEGV